MGTILADFVDQSLGIGYVGGSSMLLSLVRLSLFSWYKVEGSIISPHTVDYPRAVVSIDHHYFLPNSRDGIKRLVSRYPGAGLWRRYYPFCRSDLNPSGTLPLDPNFTDIVILKDLYLNPSAGCGSG